jgi:hypothetical protein
MICYLNGFEDAKEKLINAKQLLKPYTVAYVLGSGARKTTKTPTTFTVGDARLN